MCSRGILLLLYSDQHYGKSLPYGNLSFDVGKIHYLMMEQAIADYAVMIQHLRQQYNFTKVAHSVGWKVGHTLLF